MKNKNFDLAQKFFTTGIGLITSDGSHGKNVMAAEWTMQISHNPMLIAVFIHDDAYTLRNIRQTGYFGVNIASEEQSDQVSTAGGYSRMEVDKLNIRGLFPLKKPERTRLPMIANCVLNAECKLFALKKVGDHNMVVGKVLSIRHDETKKPLLYHRNRYFELGKKIEPKRENIMVSEKMFHALTAQSRSNFILKVVGVMVRSKNMVLVTSEQKESPVYTIPFVRPRKGKDNREEIENYLNRKKLRIMLKNTPLIKRSVIKTRDKSQRMNFILFEGILQEHSRQYTWKTIRYDSLLKSLTR